MKASARRPAQIRPASWSHRSAAPCRRPTAHEAPAPSGGSWRIHMTGSSIPERDHQKRESAGKPRRTQETPKARQPIDDPDQAAIAAYELQRLRIIDRRSFSPAPFSNSGNHVGTHAISRPDRMRAFRRARPQGQGWLLINLVEIGSTRQIGCLAWATAKNICACSFAFGEKLFAIRTALTREAFPR